MLCRLRREPLRAGTAFMRYSGDPKRYFCTFGEKEHTSKRVSIIAPDNAISKAQCATLLRYYANVVCYAPSSPPNDNYTNPITVGFFFFFGDSARRCRAACGVNPCGADRKRREKQALAFAKIERSGHSQRLCDLSHECVALLLATNR